MKYIFILLFFISYFTYGCSTTLVYSKYPDQEKNVKRAPTFNDACTDDWAKDFLCYKLNH